MLKRSRRGLTPHNLITVDGVQLALEWDEVEAGASFFIPCVHTRDVIRQVKNKAKVLRWSIKYQERVENDYFGVRFWRTM